MKKLLTTGLVTAMAIASVATSVSAAPVQEQLRLKWGLHYSEASATAIPKEEAQQIGLDALVEFFGADLSQLGNYVFEMAYSPAIIDDEPGYIAPTIGVRSMWNGTIFIPNGRTPCPEGIMLRSSDVFRFRLDSQTGELVGLQFFPSEDPVTRPNMPSECMGSPIQVFEYRDKMATQYNIEYANHAMQFAEQVGIFEGEIIRAATTSGGWMMGRNESFELVVAVTIESTMGETATLIFQGRTRKELVAVDFFASNTQISNWIYR